MSTGGRRSRTHRSLTGALHGSLWPIPCIGVVLAVGLGVALPALDTRLDRADGSPLTSGFGGGAAAARDLLAAIAGSLISVTGLVFSLTVVALQLSSTQYSPRLLQTFVTDRVVQLTLAQLVLTFVYALTVLRTVRTESATEDDAAFVPRLSITVAYLLTLGSVLALVLFLGHLARALRVEAMLRGVHDEGTRTINRELDRVSDDRGGTTPPLPPAGSVVLLARSSGFLVDVDERAAARAAAQAGVVVRLVPRMGDSVVAGTPVAHARADAREAPVDTGQLEEALEDALRLEFERSPDRDVAYSLRKVVDIALRALSPGINDPTTAVHALSHASALLGDLVARPAAGRRILDDDGALRLVLPPWDAEALVQLAVEEPLHFAEGQPAVLRRLAGLLRELAWRAPSGSVDGEVRRHLAQLLAVTARSTYVQETERQAWRDRVEEALAGNWPATAGAP